MAGIAVNTMIEDNSIECEDCKILNTDHESQLKETGSNAASKDSAADKVSNTRRDSETENFTTSLGNDVSTNDSSTFSISSQEVTVVENVSTTGTKSVTFSEASDADCNSLKYFDEICYADKMQRSLHFVIFYIC